MLTGSGVTLDALARHAHDRGWQQHFLVGSPANAGASSIAGLPARSIDQVSFERPPLEYSVVGMSDAMPYPSRTFSSLSPRELTTYKDTWRDAVANVVAKFGPDVIHCHHVWLLSSLIADVTSVPVVMHCHGTGLRQLELCPHLSEEVTEGCRRNARVLALHHQQATRLLEVLRLPEERVSVVGAGYREGVFSSDGSEVRLARTIVYAGKLSRAKGVMPLLDAIAGLEDTTLHIAGGGVGDEAEEIRVRAAELGGKVILHGRLEQDALARLLRQSAVFVLPSFYEGLPLVVIEALACGCQAVATELPGLVQEIAPHVGETLELVEMPTLIGPDRPVPEELPTFVLNLRVALQAALSKSGPVPSLARFTWRQVFDQVEQAWHAVLR